MKIKLTIAQAKAIQRLYKRGSGISNKQLKKIAPQFYPGDQLDLAKDIMHADKRILKRLR